MKKLLFMLLIAAFGVCTISAQSISVSPQSITTQACADSIQITVNFSPPAGTNQTKISLLNNEELSYHGYPALSSGGTIDSVVVNDSIHFYLSGFSTSNNLNFYLNPGCGAIKASNYNFTTTVEATFMTSTANHRVSDSFSTTVSSPFLIEASRTETPSANPEFGEIRERTLIIKNTGSLAFSGDFKLSYASQKYAEIIDLEVQAATHLSNTASAVGISDGFISGTLSNFQPSDSLVFIDTVFINSCDVDSTQTNYSFIYGCNSSDMCATVDISPFLYPNISETQPQLLIFRNTGDTSCFLSSDTMHFELGITNAGSIPARDVVIQLYKHLDGLRRTPHMLPNSLSILHNGNALSIDSIAYKTACFSDTGITIVLDTVAEFGVGDTFLINYDMVFCCGYATNEFDYYRTSITSDKLCSEGRWGLINSHQIKKFQYSQYFENLIANIQIPPGDVDRITNETYPFNIENTYAHLSDNADTNSTAPYVPLLSENNAIIEVLIYLEQGLLYEEDSLVSMRSLPGSSIDFDWHPYEIIYDTSDLGIAMGDTVIARFAIPDFFYKKKYINHRWVYDSLSTYLSDSEILFQLRGKCPALPISKITEVIRLIPDTNCSNSCGVQMATVNDQVAVMCPGCETPGYITGVFQLNRSTVGELDADNNHFPDSPGANVKADKNQIKLKRAVIGDTLDMHIESALWDAGAVTLSEIEPFHLKNTIVQLLLAPELEWVDSVQLKIHDASTSAIDSIMIPNSYINRSQANPYLDLHIDSLNAKNWPKSDSLRYYNSNDYITIDGKVRVKTNPGDAYSIIRSDVRIYGSGVLFANAGIDAGQAYMDLIPLDSTHKYWCEFMGEKTSLVRLSSGDINDKNEFVNTNFGSLYEFIVNPNRIVYFLNQRGFGAVSAGSLYDDSFPFEYRKFVELDSVIIQEPDNYRMESYTLYNRGAMHNGTLDFFYSTSDEIAPPTLNQVNNSYELDFASQYIDTTELPAFNGTNNSIVRDNYAIYSDEETNPITSFRLVPTNCAEVIGDSIPFSFKGVLGKYPGVDSTFVVEDSLYAFFPQVVLETQKISADTVYLTDTIHTSSIRLINDANNNPYYNELLGWRYTLHEMSNIFARVIAPPSVDNIVFHAGNPASFTYDYNASLNLYELNSLGRTLANYKKDIFIDYEYSCPNGVSQVVDSIVVITGWNCDGYPSDLATACQLDTNVFFIVPQPVGLDGSLERLDADQDCDTVSYAIKLNSQGAGNMVDVRAQLDLSNSSYTVFGTPEIEYSGFISNITPDVNGYFNLDEISYFEENGFDFSDGEVIIRFDLEKTGSSATETIVTNVDGLSYCGDSISFTKQIDVGPCIDLSADFVITVKTTSANETISIPTRSGWTYDYDVVWGDGETDTNMTGDASHEYDLVGTYQIRIRNTFPTIHYFKQSQTDRDKIYSIDQWGDIEWGTFDKSFWYCRNLEYNVSNTNDVPDLSNVGTLREMFRGAKEFKDLHHNGNFNNWNLSNVTNIAGMFREASKFDGEIGSWNVSNVTAMSSLFFGAAEFNSDISGWITTNLTALNGAFYAATKFNRPIGGWDVSKVTSMYQTFTWASAFNQDLSSWDVSSVTSMQFMFYNATSFNNGQPTPEVPSTAPLNWERTGSNPSTLANVQYMGAMFRNCPFNQNINNWNVSKVKDMSSMFYQATHFDQDISSWDVSEVTNMSNMFGNAVKFNQPIGSWGTKVDKVTSMYGMFFNAQLFNQPLNAWDVKSVKNMRIMFRQAYDFDQDLNSWDVDTVTDMGSMFMLAYDFDGDISDWNTENVVDMHAMFHGAGVFNQDITDWDVSAVTTMRSMFYNANSFSQDISLWGNKTGAVKNMARMFYSADAFNLDLSGWDISSVEAGSGSYQSMNNMFTQSGLNECNYDRTLRGWNTQITTSIAITLHANNVKYGVDLYRDSLIAKGWSITDGGQGTACPNLRLKSRDMIIDEIEEEAVEQSIKIYPNPAFNYFNIKGIKESAEIKLFNSLGELLIQQTVFEQARIDIDHLPNGVYYINVTQDTDQPIIKKIIKN